MTEEGTAPDVNRVSVLAAVVLLAHALSHLIAGSGGLPILIAGSLLAAGLTATGMDWLLHGHPALGGRRTVVHWLLPTLTALVIGVPLTLAGSGPQWALTFLISGVALVLVILAEYAVVESASPGYALASAGLTALALALFLILAAVLRAGSLSPLFSLPALALAAGLVSLRALQLRLGRWEFAWSAGIGLIVVQLAAGLHYWPLSPLRYGLLLAGPLLALISLAGGIGEQRPLRNAAVEPLALWALTALAAFLFG